VVDVSESDDLSLLVAQVQVQMGSRFMAEYGLALFEHELALKKVCAGSTV
jgi:hypothetical protein